MQIPNQIPSRHWVAQKPFSASKERWEIARTGKQRPDKAQKLGVVVEINAKQKEPDADEMVLILRTINEVNIPKFLSHDLPLFNGIVQDLFPGVALPAVERKEMMEAMIYQHL